MFEKIKSLKLLAIGSIRHMLVRVVKVVVFSPAKYDQLSGFWHR